MYNIAICDDSVVDMKHLRECICKHAEDIDYMQIYEYTSGEELLEAMGDIPFTLIFLDVQMEGMDGGIGKQHGCFFQEPQKKNMGLLTVHQKSALRTGWKICMGFGYPHDSYVINFKYLMVCTGRELKLEGYEDISLNIARSKAREFHLLKSAFMNRKYKRGKEK